MLPGHQNFSLTITIIIIIIIIIALKVDSYSEKPIQLTLEPLAAVEPGSIHHSGLEHNQENMFGRNKEKGQLICFCSQELLIQPSQRCF